MSVLTYYVRFAILCVMAIARKRVRWLKGEIKTPPFSKEARMEAGYRIGQLQEGMKIGMPHSRPMPAIGAGCHELRIKDRNVDWPSFTTCTRKQW